eukprot:c4875_g1_i1.p1 GENE.c4875_g1_i1~~c4875_g1_i1.p1  ORF type:complete len:586 (+),score=116.50 c4875_g1_i1:26-1783(+)
MTKDGRVKAARSTVPSTASQTPHDSSTPDTHLSSHSSPPSLGLVCCVGAVVLAILVGALQSGHLDLRGEFVLDDIPAIVKNKHLHGNFSDALWSIYHRDFFGQDVAQTEWHLRPYRPLTSLTFALQSKLRGAPSNSKGAFEYRLVNVLIHLVNSVGVSVLAFHILRCRTVATSAANAPTTKATPHASESLFSSAVTPAAVSGILFALHPLATQAVLLASGRAVLLAQLFSILGIFSFSHVCQLLPEDDDETDKATHQVHRTGGHAQRSNIPSAASSSRTEQQEWWSREGVVLDAHFISPVWLAMSVGFSVLAVYASEQAAIVLFTYVAFDLIFVCEGKIVTLVQWAIKGKVRGQFWMLAFGMRTLAVLSPLLFWIYYRPSWLYGEHLTLSDPHSNPAHLTQNTLYRILSKLHYNALAVKLLFVPNVLSCDWSGQSVPLVAHLTDSQNVLTVTIAMSLLLVGIIGRHSPVVLFSLVAVLISLLPQLGWLWTVGHVISEHDLYLAILPACLLIAAFLHTAIAKSRASSSWAGQSSKLIAIALVVILVGAYASWTYRRAPDWQVTSKPQMKMKSEPEVQSANVELINH